MFTYLKNASRPSPDPFIYRHQLPFDRVQLLLASEPTMLQGVISNTERGTDGSVTQVIDRSVSVWSPVDKETRARHAAVWQKAATEKYFEAGGSTVVAVASGVAGANLILPWVTWPLCATSSVNAVVAVVQGLHASIQAARWADPAQRIAFHRGEMGRNGWEHMFKLSRSLVPVTEAVDLDVREFVSSGERNREWTKSVTLLKQRHGLAEGVGIFPSEHAMLAEFFVDWSPLSTAGILLGVEAPSQELVVRGQHFDWFRGRLGHNAYTVGQALIRDRRDAGFARLERDSAERRNMDNLLYERCVNGCYARFNDAVLHIVNHRLSERGLQQMQRLPAGGVAALPVELKNDPTVKNLEHDLQGQLSHLATLHLAFQTAERDILARSKSALSQEADARLAAIRTRQTAANTAMIRAMRLLSGEDDRAPVKLNDERSHFEHSEEILRLESAIQDLLAHTFGGVIPVYNVIEFRWN